MSKVECQCCKRMMVPSIIYSRGLWISWMVRLDGHIRGSVCPFCLSESWDGGKHPEHRSIAQKSTVLLGLIVSVGCLRPPHRDRRHSSDYDSK